MPLPHLDTVVNFNHFIAFIPTTTDKDTIIISVPFHSGRTLLNHSVHIHHVKRQFLYQINAR